MKQWYAVAAAVILSTGACGESSDSTDSRDTSAETETAVVEDDAMSAAWQDDPCSLISNQEMSDLLPNPVDGRVISAGLCEYGPVDLNIGRVDVEVFVQDVTATGCDLFFSVGGFESARPVDDIGTAARWKGESGAKQLGVCVEDEVAMAITVYDPDEATDPLATSISVAELVIARL